VYVAVFDTADRGGRAESSLARADRRCLRVGVDDARHRFVVGLPWFAEDVCRNDLALVLPDVGQWPEAVDVADRPETLDGAQMPVNCDPMGTRVDAHRLEPEIADARATARCQEEVIAADLAAIVQFQDVVLAIASRRGGVHAQEEFDPVAA
jgi:hypothetical protein